MAAAETREITEQRVGTVKGQTRGLSLRNHLLPEEMWV